MKFQRLISAFIVFCIIITFNFSTCIAETSSDPRIDYSSPIDSTTSQHLNKNKHIVIAFNQDEIFVDLGYNRIYNNQFTGALPALFQALAENSKNFKSSSEMEKKIIPLRNQLAEWDFLRKFDSAFESQIPKTEKNDLIDYEIQAPFSTGEILQQLNSQPNYTLVVVSINYYLTQDLESLVVNAIISSYKNIDGAIIQKVGESELMSKQTIVYQYHLNKVKNEDPKKIKKENVWGDEYDDSAESKVEYEIFYPSEEERLARWSKNNAEYVKRELNNGITRITDSVIKWLLSNHKNEKKFPPMIYL